MNTGIVLGVIALGALITGYLIGTYSEYEGEDKKNDTSRQDKSNGR